MQNFLGERKDDAEKLNTIGNMLEDGGAAAAGPLLPPSRD